MYAKCLRILYGKIASRILINVFNIDFVILNFLIKRKKRNNESTVIFTIYC